MANIVNELNDILRAIRGEEVRQSIYRSLVNVNLQTERLEDVVGALNDAITAETSTNVRSFVEKVENAIWYKDGDTVSFEDCGNDFFMVPGLYTRLYASGGTVNKRIFYFTLDLPKSFKPSDNGYTITIDDLTIDSWYTATSSGNSIDIVENGVLASGVTQCAVSNENNINKLHFRIDIEGGASTSSEVPAGYTVSKLGFTITENTPE